MLLHASPDAFTREEIWHVCLVVVIKDIVKLSKLLQVETFVKHSMSSESSGESAVAVLTLKLLGL